MQAKAPAQRLDSAADVHKLPLPEPNGHLPAFDYQPRTRVVFGPGKISELGTLAAELGAQRVLLVTDQGLETAGHPQKGIAALESAGLTVALFDDVQPNPTTDDVDRGLAIAQAARIDLIVGLGGGSSMDCAKGINFLLTNGGRIEDYWGANKARMPMLPMIAVPTTSGTGSEAQSYALIAHPESHMKMACGDPKAACRIALLDPALTVSMPASVTAATGIDALSHAVESYVSTRRNPVSQLFSRQAWQLLTRGFPTVVAKADHLDARARMLLGAHLAGAAIENSMLGAAHALANPLSAHFNVIHGVAIAVMLPHVIRYNAESAAKLYGDLAVDAGLCDARQCDGVQFTAGDVRGTRGGPSGGAGPQRGAARVLDRLRCRRRHDRANGGRSGPAMDRQVQSARRRRAVTAGTVRRSHVMVTSSSNGVSGGPAVCAAPAGSRSDKKPRRASTFGKQTCTLKFAHLGHLMDMESAWRSFSSLRDPTALTGRSGHPSPALRPPGEKRLHLSSLNFQFAVQSSSSSSWRPPHSPPRRR